MTAEEIWEQLELIPGFNEAMRRAEDDLEAGKGIPFDDPSSNDDPETVTLGNCCDDED